jgi:hypothetical protein
LHCTYLSRKESKAAPAVPPVRAQPSYSSLSVLSRDDSSMYKVAGSSNSNRSLASLCDSENSALTPAERLENDEAAAVALAVAQIEEMELIDQSSSNVEGESEVDVEVKQAGKSVIPKPVKEKKEVKKVKKSSALPLDGWGSAIQAVGIGAPVKKVVTGLSLAKPIKKAAAAASVSKVSNSAPAVTQSRSFDDLKQIGRYQRDLEEQQQLQLDAEMQLESKRSHSEKKEPSFGVDDFPVLGGAGRSGSAPHPHSSTNSKYSSSSGVESMCVGSASSLTVEQRNENIRAFVQEARMKKALNSPPLDIDLYDSEPYSYDDGSYGGSNYFDGINSNYSSSSRGNDKEKGKSDASGTGAEKSTARVGNWTKMGGVSAAPAPPSDAEDEYEFIDYTKYAAPISFNDSDYPSLGPGPPKKANGVKSNGNGKYTAAALTSGISRPAKSAADLLLAKKEKTNKKIANLVEDGAVGKA